MVGDVKANPRDFIGTSIVRKKTIKVFRPLKEEEELVLQIPKLNRLRDLMVSLRMCSTKMIIFRSHFSEGTILEIVESITYLGVTVTNDLRWNTRQQYLH